MISVSGGTSAWQSIMEARFIKPHVPDIAVLGYGNGITLYVYITLEFSVIQNTICLNITFN